MDNKGFEQDSIPTYSEPMSFGREKKFECSCLYVLLFYAGALTAGLITLAVTGGLYISSLDNIACQTNGSIGTWKDYTVAMGAVTQDTDMTQDVYLNVIANKQMMEDGNGSITVIDFTRGICGHYDREADYCYLIGGLDGTMASAAELEDQLLDGQPLDGYDEDEEYYPADVMKDNSFLPTELQTVCAGRATAWLNRNTTQAEEQLEEIENPGTEDRQQAKCVFKSIKDCKFKTTRRWWRWIRRFVCVTFKTYRCDKSSENVL